MIVTRNQTETLLAAHTNMVNAMIALVEAIGKASEALAVLTTAVLVVAHKEQDREIT